MGQYSDIRMPPAAEGLGLFLIGMQPDMEPEIDRALSQTERVDVRTVPSLYHYAWLRGAVTNDGVLPILSLSESPAVGWRGVVKRTSDVLFSGAALVLGAPLLLAVAAAVKLTSSGPALYYQDRVGVDGKTFRLFKFRTMLKNAERETGPIWARNHDPRCSPIGAFLRRTSLDELPQLWNVLKGEMSLVGPRPERPMFVKQFGAETPRYNLRHSVKGGMTGWAQIKGWRGNTSLDQRIQHDLHYIENWSPAFDLKIIARTVLGGFLNRNAY